MENAPSAWSAQVLPRARRLGSPTTETCGQSRAHGYHARVTGGNILKILPAMMNFRKLAKRPVCARNKD